MRDAAVLSVASMLRRGEGEGSPLPEATPTDAVGSPLTLGEHEPEKEAAADWEAEKHGVGVPDRADDEADCDNETSTD